MLWQAGEQSEENESVLCLSKDPERGKHFYFSSAKVLLLFDICKFFGRKIYFYCFFLAYIGKKQYFSGMESLTYYNH